MNDELKADFGADSRNAHTRAVLDWRDDQVTQEILRTATNGGPLHAPQCRKGCFWCCKEPLLVTDAETDLAVASIPEAERPGVVKRLRAWLKIARQTILQDKKPRKVVPYRELNLWCPMLNDGACLIYDNRPLGCRAHVAILSPELCESDELRPRQKFQSTPGIDTQAVLQLNADHADHFGVMLANQMLGTKHRSCARIKLPNIGHDGEKIHKTAAAVTQIYLQDQRKME